jgi:hypothetical protein
MEHTPPKPSQDAGAVGTPPPAAKFIVLTFTFVNPSESTGRLTMQGNFDPGFGIQVRTEDGLQQLGAGGISLTAVAGTDQQEFVFECGKSTPWVGTNPPLQCALKLTGDSLAMGKFDITGSRIAKVDITYLGD